MGKLINNNGVFEYNDVHIDSVFAPLTLFMSMDECKRGTIWKDSVLSYYNYYDMYLPYLLDSLYNGTFRFDNLFHTVICERGTERLLSSLTIKDRIVHKAMNQNLLLPLFSPKLIYENCACLKGRGLDYALNIMTNNLCNMYRNYGKNFYILKCDIRKYFDNIPHNYCLDITNKYISDKNIMNILEQVFSMYYYDAYIHNGKREPYGVGLGGEIPQTYGLVCLNEMDHIIKEQLEIPAYVRYADDFVLMHNNIQYLSDCENKIEFYLNNNLGLELNKNKTQIMPASEGVKFLKIHFMMSDTGKIIRFPDKTILSKERSKLNSMYELYMNGVVSKMDVLQSYMSWSGCYLRSDSYDAIGLMDQLFDDLFAGAWANDILGLSLARYHRKK